MKTAPYQPPSPTGPWSWRTSWSCVTRGESFPVSTNWSTKWVTLIYSFCLNGLVYQNKFYKIRSILFAIKKNDASSRSDSWYFFWYEIMTKNINLAVQLKYRTAAAYIIYIFKPFNRLLFKPNIHGSVILDSILIKHLFTKMIQHAWNQWSF